MKLVYQNMPIFFNFKTTSNHFHSLQVENCDSNSRLVVDEDDNGKFRLERVKTTVVVISSERVNVPVLYEIRTIGVAGCRVTI